MEDGLERIQIDGVRTLVRDVRIIKYFITTLIDYESFNDIGISLQTLQCHNSSLFDRYLILQIDEVRQVERANESGG